MPSKILLRSLFVFGFCAGSNAIAAEIILQPVSASGNHTIQGTEIRLEGGGQRVRLEVQIRGFAPHLLKTYQARLDSSGYNNGGGSMELRAAVVACPSDDNEGDLFCRSAFGETGIGAPDCVDVDYGPNVDLRCEAAWINQSRTDWIMFGHDSIAAVDISSPNYRWGGTTVPGDEVMDEGLTYYAGTLMIDVPSGAVGAYTIGWDDNEFGSFLVTPPPQDSFITPLNFTDAKITVACTSDDQCAPLQCRVAVCDTISGECQPKPDGTSCTDCNPCTGADECQSGTCVGEPVTCSGVEQCTYSNFDSETGECSPPRMRQTFTVCDDFNNCTYGDYCVAGECWAGHSSPNGTACNDGSGCTLGDRCVSGECSPLSTVECTGDACNNPGSCIPETGLCSSPVPKPDGTACSDNNPCTLQDQCVQGECISGAPVICTNQCRESACDPILSQCRPLPNGTACNDGNGCTLGDRCMSGECAPTWTLVCSSDDCNNPGACIPETGACSPPVPKPDGTACSDYDPCTLQDQCVQGECISGAPMICLNPCRACHPISGNCRPVPNGTECDDGKACTLGDRCDSGNCIPASRVVCTNGDACNDAGACIPQTGECSLPVPKPHGSACDDGDLCTANQCQQGECLSAAIPDCIQWRDMFDCLLGPENPKPIECDSFDLNSDGFVDMFDVALLLEVY